MNNLPSCMHAARFEDREVNEKSTEVLGIPPAVSNAQKPPRVTSGATNLLVLHG